jgi:hypothetical protein
MNMHSTKEIILRFPLLKSLRHEKNDNESKELFKSRKEKELYYRHVIENEWRQEYFLIYNSYILET